MTDREKVLRGLECCGNSNPVDGCPEECPYIIKSNPGWCCTFFPLIDYALALLREREPIWKEGVPFCGECKTAMTKTQNYCHKCGKAVKWDADNPNR